MRLTELTKWLAVGLLVLASAAVRSATLSVPEDAPTIQGAMLKARPGDIILISCGTYLENGIHVKPGVALWSGTLQPSCVTVDAQGRGPVFIFSGADTTTALVGMTLTGGQADLGGAVQIRSGSPRLSNCIFTGNEAGSGGAIHADKESRPALKNCLFRSNTARRTGGALVAEGGLRLQECAFEGNVALLGGALYLNPGASLQAFSSSFLNNEAGNTGGAIHLQGAEAGIHRAVFAGNLGGLGGAALSLNDSRLELDSCTLVGHGADADGAVLAVQGPAPGIVNTIVAFSEAEILRTDSRVPSFRGCNLWGNRHGDWVSNLRSLAGKENNISRDPLFCAPEYGNYTLKNTSSCLPEHNPSGNKGLVGAFGAGCAANGAPGEETGARGSGFRAVRAGF